MPTHSKYLLFVSSVQREFAAERREVKDFVEADALLGRFFSVFLFEDIPASGRRPDEVYLEEVDRSALYVGLFGNDYGYEDAEGFSPTEREFDRATAAGKERLIFVKGTDDKARHPKMAALVSKAGAQLIRRRFQDSGVLKAALYASLVQFLDERGVLQSRPFDERIHPDATLADLDEEVLTRFVRMARHERQFALAESTPVPEILTHLDLLRDGQPSQGALLLFGKKPQRFFPATEVRCMHFHGTTIQRPAPFYQIFKGNLFSLVEQTVDFILSKLDYRIGTRAESAQAPGEYELPPSVIREAVVNSIAHRDYTQPAAIQVSVFSDRIEIRNPGGLLPPLTSEQLHRPHASIARNHHICEALYLARYIEKYGTGTLMMIAETTACALPEPDFEAMPGEFIITLWRDWLTPDVVARLGLNERQALAIAYVKQHGRISNPDYQTLAKTTKKTATRDLSDLKTRGLFEQRGERGPGVHYVLVQKRDIMGTLGTLGGNSIGSESAQSGHELPLKATQKRDKKGTNGTSSPPENPT
jgi:predicted HTH transcriptional regulator